MSTTQKPSEHAMRAAKSWYFVPNKPISDEVLLPFAEQLAEEIDQHAIAPAVAQRDKRIAELEAVIEDIINYLTDESDYPTMDLVQIEKMMRDALTKKGQP